MQNKNSKKGIIIYIVILLILMFVASRVFTTNMNEKPRPYNEIISYFQNEKVEKYTLNYGSGELSIKLKGELKEVKYLVPNLGLFVEDTHDLVKEYNIEHPDSQIVQVFIPPTKMPWWATMVPSLLLLVIMVVFWFVIMRQARGGGGNPMAFAKAKPKTLTGTDKVTFDMVAGAEEEKQELAEIVDFLKNPQRYNALGARIPKGVLLMGPPGTGKTLLAKAVAGEAGVPFFSISGSDFVEMFVGVGASRVRDLFENAKKAAPSIVFIDEIDAVGRRRGTGLGGGHDEREQTLNQLLVEMDGFGANSGVIVIAATNRKDILDPALLRPGRFDRHVMVGYPDVKGREEILKVHTRNKPIAPDVDLRVIAQTSGGFTGADLENLVNEAALGAARKAKKAITMDEIQEATLKVIIGPEKRSHLVVEKERHLTAVHEAGHAIVTFYCETQDKVHQVSIIPRGGAGGFTLSLPEKDVMYRTRNQMYEDICTLLGGRVAEQLVLDDISTGASNDIERATNVARAMVTRYGFSEKLGTMVYGKDDNEVFLGMDLQHDRGYSEQIAAVIDDEIRALIDKAYAQAEKLISENMEKLKVLADYLEKYEKIDGETFAKLMRGEISTDELEVEAKRAEEEEQRKREEDKKRILEDEKNKENSQPSHESHIQGVKDSFVRKVHNLHESRENNPQKQDVNQKLNTDVNSNVNTNTESTDVNTENSENKENTDNSENKE